MLFSCQQTPIAGGTWKTHNIYKVWSQYSAMVCSNISILPVLWAGQAHH